MRAKPEHRDRDETEVAVLDALADRREEGMTVFELRSHVDEDIDTLEDALGDLKNDGLIEAREKDSRTVILPDESAVGPVESDDEEPDIFDRIRDRLPF
jgi:DNA-binding transcriptional ArsR family regulator